MSCIGTMTLNAGTLTVETGGFVRALGSATAGGGGTLTANVGDVAIDGTVDASGAPRGTLTVTASGNLFVTGSVTARALTVSDNGGQVQLTAAKRRATPAPCVRQAPSLNAATVSTGPGPRSFAAPR
jgi:hypothetical protein